MIRSRSIALLATALVLGVGATRDAMAQRGSVEGVARANDDGAPVPFALVRLVRVEASPLPSDSSPQGITSADGRYRFGGVAPGRYRVQLLRIGFRPVLSEAVQVAAGETVQLALRVTSQPIELPPVTVTAETCVTVNALVRYPELQALWQQARDGASIREGLMARYRFRTDSREVGFEISANGAAPPGTVNQTLVSDPKWAFNDAMRNRRERLSRGYYAPNDGWYLPNELDVLHEDFLNAHCLDAVVERGDGEVGMHFRPLKARRNFLDVRGTIWLDSSTYLARRIELEYVDGEESRGTVRLAFGDVAVDGSTLRMPVGGAYANLRPSRKNPAKRIEGKITLTYSGFVEVPPR